MDKAVICLQMVMFILDNTVMVNHMDLDSINGKTHQSMLGNLKMG
jgi:hypothetical protein